MDRPVLTTKLYIPPPRPELVPRPRLLRQLDEGLRLGHRLTLVSAPAGFGKTTLLKEWATHLDPSTFLGAAVGEWDRPPRPIRNRIAWLSLDDEDNEPGRFWAYLIAALQTVDADLGRDALELLRTPQPPPVRALLTTLLNDIAARPQVALGEGIVLILDDYHLISAPAIHEGLGFLLEHLPALPRGMPGAPLPRGMHLVLSTRADPPLPIFRLRARAQLTELRSDDLRFAPGEAATFLNATMGLDLAPEDLEALGSRTEGWIVGLQLAALSLQGRTDARSFIAAFGGSHRYVLEYLTEEVLRRQPESVRRFLIRTSILDRLSGPLCDAVLDVGAPLSEPSDASLGASQLSPSQAMLGELERRNLFIVPLDDRQHWYRYHHLFADLLGNLLRGELPRDRISELHLRASARYEENGRADDAVKHALRARDFERAASLIERAAQGALSQGRPATLLNWLEALPGPVLQSRPHLRLYQGWALHLSGQTDAGEQILRETKTILQGMPASPGNDALRGQLAALLTGIATLREETASVFQEARDALDYLPEEDPISRARVYVALGTAYAYEDNAEQAARTWRQARDLALEAGNPFLATAAIELLAGTQIYHQGRLRAGARDLREVLELGTTPDGKRLPFTGTSHALLAEVHLEWNDLDAAAGYLEKGIELQRQGGIGYGLIHTFCANARLERARGDAEAAVQALQTAEQALQAHPMWHMVLHLASYQVQLRLWLGDVEAAARWAEGDAATLQREEPDTLPIYLREVQQISLARVHLARGATGRVLATLEGLEEQAQAAGRLAQAVEISLLKALAWQSQGESAAALASLERSLSWAEPEGYVRLFLEAGTDLIPLLRRAASGGIKPGYTSKLLAAFGLEEEARVPSTQRSDLQSLVEPLTDRELEVLHLICDGMSNREIAQRLNVTLNTVKKHSSHIYGKLGVSSRAQAIVRAQELGMR